MPIGPSGRIVVEIDPDMKRELYAALGAEDLSLRDWFIRQANQYLSTRGQLTLRFNPRDDRQTQRASDEVPA